MNNDHKKLVYFVEFLEILICLTIIVMLSKCAKFKKMLLNIVSIMKYSTELIKIYKNTLKGRLTTS
jgi:hypothetical protein